MIALTDTATGILEALFFTTIVWRLLHRTKLHKGPFFVFVVCVGYVLAGYISSRPTKLGELKDFATIYKFLYYLGGLTLLSSGTWLRAETGAWMLRLMIWLFVAVYSYSRFVAGVPRPIVFTENNYELIPLLIAAVALTAKGRGLSVVDWIALTYVCAISGSRSSVVSLVLAFTILLRFRFTTRTLIQWAGLAAALIIAAQIIVTRMGEQDMESIDRIVFLGAFLFEVQEWGLVKWLLGAPAMTPLSNGTCQLLSYYETLMSYSGDGTCYSVILHSFVLRAIFDHGVLGLALALGCVHYLLRRTEYSLRPRLTILSIIIATGMSVSSLNNVYVGIGLLFVVALQVQHRNGLSGARGTLFAKPHSHLGDPSAPS